MHSLDVKGSFLILIFLIVCQLGQKESCKTSLHKHNTVGTVMIEHDLEKKFTADFEEKQTSGANGLIQGKIPRNCHLLVIGGGPQCVALLAKLVASGIKLPFTVIIVETKPTFGSGLPFDENVVTHEHLLNLFSASAVTITGLPMDFLSWVHGAKDLPKDFIKKSQTGSPSSPPRRSIIGKYLTDRFFQFVERLRLEKHYDMFLANSSTAQNISLHHSGLFDVKLSTGISVLAEDVFLATGHWYQSRFDDPPKGYYESPWPACLLKREIPAAHIGIFGMGLSAIDAVLTLARKFGHFENDDSVYKIRLGSEDFGITMYSRSGHLPRVEDGRPDHPTYAPKHMTTQNIAKLLGGDDSAAFNEILTLLKNDLLELVPSVAERDDIQSMRNKDFFDRLDNALHLLKSPKQSFIDDMENKMSILEIRINQLYQKSHELFNMYMKKFTGEQMVIFKERLASRILKPFTRVPLANAKKLRALMDDGRLNLTAVGSDCKVTEKDGGQGVLVKYRDQEPGTHDYFIDAMGQNGQIARDPRQLTQSLLESGLAEPHRIPYEDQANARIFYERLNGIEDSVDIEGIDKKRTRLVGGEDGVIVYEADGINMDKKKMLVIPRRGVSPKGDLYASAPFTFSFDSDVQDLQKAVLIAGKAVDNMKKTRGTTANGGFYSANLYTLRNQ